ncbi:helix-turn-helix domain-containing protein [Nocardia takedensis]|uniref:helix-turn-helix domain-containing protein n=1 Tax=Nocardia takedensis TaxID=259390 RepID=UPI0009FC665F|nr:helix-turn-helix domain-containing protein [Nocardia takedensis]
MGWIPKTVPTPGIPTMGTILRLIREDANLARHEATRLHGVSPSYLYEIESDAKLPKIETLEAMIEGYNVDPLLARHLRELRSPAVELESLSQIRRRVTTNADWMSHLEDLEARHTLAAYVDPLWNILACNTTWLAALPGIEETMSIARWIFGPRAKRVFVEWEREAAHNVAFDKAMLGLFRDSSQAREIIGHLAEHPDFRRLWASSLTVAYGRDTDDLLHHRDFETGTLTSYRLSIAPMDETGVVQLVTAIAKTYSGPVPPRRITVPRRNQSS